MEQVKKRGRAFISIVLSLLLAVGGVTYLSNGNQAYGASAVANPTPKIDIAVSVPADYPGTFLDYKAELEEKLIAEGLDPNDFRITSSAVQIDTTDLSDWYVYDHYGNSSHYIDATRSLTPTQKEKQPERIDPYYGSAVSNGTPEYTTVEAQSKVTPDLGKAGLLKAWKYNRHIWSTRDAAGKAKMVFAGYYQNCAGLNDYMIYPASSDSRRTISFDIDGKNVHMHSMSGAGFLLNAGISGTGDNAIIHGYLLYYQFQDEKGAYADSGFTNGKGRIHLLKFNANQKAKSFNHLSANSTVSTATFTSVKTIDFDLGGTKRARLDVDLQKDKVTIQQRNYNADNTFGAVQNILTNQPLDATGYNGFGPFVGHMYSGHGCSSCSSFTFSDLEMSYEADAFDGLKSSQFYEDADYKYFINLAGTSNDPAIPDVTDANGKKAFDQGIERLAQNEIFYISNWNDGNVLTDKGVTTANGLYATSSDSVGQIARYIATNFNEKVAYNKDVVNITVDKPLANLVVRAKGDASTGGKDVQALTLHLRHLATGEKVVVYVDGSKSIASTAGTVKGEITGYQLRVYDPNNNVKINTAADTWFTKEQLEAQTLELAADAVQGRYTFELVVKDSHNQVSTACQTFLTVYNDTQPPSVAIKGHGRESKVTITLTDHGYGIDSDGITLLPDQGGGIKAYQINRGDIVDVPDAPHEFTFEKNLSELEIYEVKVWDECGNEKTFSYNTTRVEFVDENGRRLDTRDPQYVTYYVPWDTVSEGGEIGELPEVPASADRFKYAAGWAQVGGKMNGQLIGPNTQLKDMLTLSGTTSSARVITLKPAYTTNKVKVSFNAEGGTFTGGTDTKQIEVAEGSALSLSLLTGANLPKKTGYTFDKWVMAAGNVGTTSQPATALAEGVEVTTQQALVPEVATDAIKLKAVWKIGEYDLKFDANGGTLGTLKKRTLQYGDQIKPATETDQAGNAYAGNSLPTREGYIFMGWSATKQGLLPDSTTTKVTVDASLTMGESGATVYATWKKDTSRYIIHFHLDNGADTEDGNEGMLNDMSRLAATEKTYPTLPTASRSGYTFKGWYTAPEGAATAGTMVTAGMNTNGTAGAEIDLYAQWTPNQVSYNVVYYTKQSATDGDYIRAQVKQYKANTGDTVTLPDDAMIDIANYWFNAAAPKNNHTESLVVKGDGTTQFSLYYDRMLTITTEANAGGTIDPAVTLKEGQTAQVNWTVAEGYRVKSVLVDNELRDDLKTAGKVNFDEPVVNNRTVKVVFEKIPEPTTPGTPGTPTPTPTPARKAYTVATEIKGCGAGAGCDITPTSVYPADSTAVINWASCGACKVTKVEVDGEVVAQGTIESPVDTTSLSLTGLSADHTVVVTVSGSSRPTLGGSTVTGPTNDGYYTVTVNRYGGDEQFETSSTRTISYASAATDDWKFSWDKKESKYRIYEIRVNGGGGAGGAVYGGASGTVVADKGDITLGSRSTPRNYVVDVYFYEIADPTTEPTAPTDPENPDGTGYVKPSFGTPEEWITVTTQIVGGAGEIDGSFVAKKEAGVKRTVTYKLDNDKDPDAADYAFYQVKKVEVTGDDSYEVVEGKNEIKVSLSKDADVKVYVEPVTRQVQTMAVTSDKDGGVLSTTVGGSLAASRIVGLHGNYTDIAASPRFGYRVGAVEVPVVEAGVQTGTEVWIFDKTTGAATKLKTTSTKAAAASVFSISDMPRLASGAVANGEVLAEDPTPLASLVQLLGVETAYAADADENVYNEKKNPALDAEGNLSMAVRNVTADQRVVVYFVADESTDDTVKKVVDDREEGKLTQVSVSVVDAAGNPVPGAGVEGAGFIAAEDEADLTVIVPAGYKVVSVGGKAVAEDAGQPSNGRFTFTQAGADAVEGVLDVQVVLAPIERPTNPVLPSGFKSTVRVTTTVKGYGSVTITPSKEMSAGVDHAVEWAIQNTASPMADDVAVNVPYIIKVELDGKSVPRTGTKYTLGEQEISTTASGRMDYAKIDSDHQVAVTSILMNEDTDNDGKPDQNLDTTGDGNPDTNVDTDGNGTPDVNVVVPDPENPGKTIKLNEDTDGDGEPDINIVDADGDGKPDDIDPKVTPAPLPNVNVVVPDPEYPGKTIILNEDKDGDGIPDINIVDTDGDGKPDPVSPNNPKPPLPNVNVDTNGDGIPDLNIDKDGDGKPDEKIVDADGDGKPDGISPNNPTPPEPTVNIPGTDPVDPGKDLILNQDTNGDGIPDVNVVKPDPNDPTKTIIINKDVDGDGIPDINIDTNGDGIPDVNIDTNGDNIPDRNIDTDGTGVWKPSSQGGNADGIWKPDMEIYYGEDGPYTDTNAPVDENGDGVDDNWNPLVNPHKPQDPGNQDPDDPNNNQGDGNGNGGTTPGGDSGNNGGDGNVGGTGTLPITGDDTGNGATGWNPQLSQTGQTLSQTADENLPFIIMIGGAFVVSSLIAAAAMNRRREEDL